MIVAYIGPFLPFLVFVGHSQYVAPTLPMLAILASSAFFKKKAVAPNAESRKTPEHVAVPN
jgi:hypothetical protein